MTQERFISIVIPTHNGAATIGRCLAAALASDYPRFEVVVVDDGSTDGSAAIIEAFPVKLLRTAARGGVSRARNAGAAASSGELLFFIDADCLLPPDALSVAHASYGAGGDRILGGTYTPRPYDADFFSWFQSVFVHHFETKRAPPDYVAAHAMVIDAGLFRRSGGFAEGSFIGFAASVEDVELSHRLRRAGCELVMDPRLRVQHIFRFSLRRSLRNAVTKASYWTTYSLANRDVLADSGTASRELKTNVVAGALQALLAGSSLVAGSAWPLVLALSLLVVNLHVNRRLVVAWYAARGLPFAALALLYYTTLYASAVGIGGLAGFAKWLWTIRLLGRYRSCAPRSDTCHLSS
jgi:glycosyltransferase involved in cell wall biosynthesis